MVSATLTAQKAETKTNAVVTAKATKSARTSREYTKRGLQIKNKDTSTISFADLKEARISRVSKHEAITYVEDGIGYLVYHPSRETFENLRISEIEILPCWQVVVGVRILVEGTFEACSNYLEGSRRVYADENSYEIKGHIEQLLVGAKEKTIYEGEKRNIDSLLYQAKNLAGWFNDQFYSFEVGEAAEEIKQSIRFGESLREFGLGKIQLKAA